MLDFVILVLGCIMVRVAWVILRNLYDGYDWVDGYAYRKEEPPPPLELTDVVDYTVQDRLELQSYMANPLAVWLDPTRWTRPGWPDAPTEADLRFDGSAADLAAAYATITPAQRAALPANAPARISSIQRWDRRQGLQNARFGSLRNLGPQANRSGLDPDEAFNAEEWWKS